MLPLHHIIFILMLFIPGITTSKVKYHHVLDQVQEAIPFDASMLNESTTSGITDNHEMYDLAPAACRRSLEIRPNLKLIQKGIDIQGETPEDRFGSAVSLSGDGRTIAVGAPLKSNNGIDSGYVRVFRYFNKNETWIQIGADIVGDVTGDEFGISVSLSKDGGTLAVGTLSNDKEGNPSGYVRVFRYEDADWIQVANFDGESPSDWFGRSISLSKDGRALAVGAIGHNGNDSNIYSPFRGQVRVFRDVNNMWKQQGSVIDGESTGDRFGWSVSLSENGQTLAVGARNNDGESGVQSGHVRVFRLVEGKWTPMGNGIEGEAAYDRFGMSVSISGDGSVLAAGSRFNSGMGNKTGHVRVFRYTLDERWIQIGDDINGEEPFEKFGRSVSISEDGTTLAVSAGLKESVNIFRYIGERWIQIVEKMDGVGVTVSLSDDGNTLAVGNYKYDRNSAPTSGHVSVFELSPSSDSDASKARNPARGYTPFILGIAMTAVILVFALIIANYRKKSQSSDTITICEKDEESTIVPVPLPTARPLPPPTTK